MTAELVALTDELRVATEMLGRVSARLDAADARANRHRLWTVVLALCVLAEATLFGLFYTAEKHDDHRACIAANEARADIRNGIVSTVVKVIERRGEDPAQFQPLIDDISSDLRKTLPDRTC